MPPSPTRRARPARLPPDRDGRPDDGSTARREAALLDYTTRAVERLETPDPGAEALRHLTDQARLSLLVGTHRSELATLMTRLGPEGARAALGRFLAQAPATAWSGEQGPAFDAWYAALVTEEPALAGSG